MLLPPLPPESQGLPLDRAIADLLSRLLARKVGRSWVRQLIVQGKLLNAGQRLTLQGRPPVGARLSLDDALLAPPSRSPGAALDFSLDAATVFRDEHWLAVNKPEGLLVHPGADKSQPCLTDLIAKALEDQPWTLIHRLDRETSGLVLLALSEVGRRSAAVQFEERQVEKLYVCYTEALPARHPRMWTSSEALLERRGRVSVVRSSLQGQGQSAVTEFSWREAEGRRSRVEARPRSGRKHQIRVHLAARGFPILGDLLYGGRAAERLMLHAHRLELEHPQRGRIRLEAPLPADFS